MAGSAGSPPEYRPVMTPGREVFERWLYFQDVSPDDLWDHLPEHERLAWERVAVEYVPREQSDALAEALDFLIDLPHHPSLLTDEDYVTIEDARKALNSYREATSE